MPNKEYLFKPIKRLLKILVITSVVLVGLYYLLIYLFFYSTIILPKGQLISEISSPDKKNVAKVYLVETEELCTRVEVASYGENNGRMIYWSWNEGNNPNVKWIDNNTIFINNKTLNIHKDKYDKRQEKKLY